MIRKSFQKGHIGKRSTQHGVVYDIRYRVRIPGGKWKQRCETLKGLGDGKAGRQKTEEVLRNRVKDANPASAQVLPASITFRRFLDTEWQHYLDLKQIKPSTRASYSAYLQKHVLPALGDFDLSDIASIHVGGLLANEAGGGLSSRSLFNLYRLLHTIFRVAVNDDFIQRSPVRGHHRPNYRHPNKPVWEPEEFRCILANIPQKHRTLVTTVALSGARIGEILGLKWKHIDFSSSEIKIAQSLWRGKLQTTKTENSDRIMPMTDLLISVLSQHQHQSMQTNPDSFVFCHLDGRPLDPDVLRCDVLYPAIERAGLVREKRSHGWHAFRHTASTLIYREILDLKAARMYLGNSDSKTTELYTHVNKPTPEAARVLERTLFGDLLQTVTKTTPDGQLVRPI